MSNRAKGLVIGLSGFFSGACVASVVDLETWPKALFAAVVGALVSIIAWVLLRPRRTT